MKRNEHDANRAMSSLRREFSRQHAATLQRLYGCDPRNDARGVTFNNSAPSRA